MRHRPNAEELAATLFRTSSYSGANGNECVAVARIEGWSCVRDSKQADGPVVVVPGAALAALTDALKNGTL
ncbi:DUF397 domain-containing protein [Streptomyces sp. NPDC096136]|uniref:DUF397 domain-containing protein n=1 Tax=Streptomyces sp. NPDC096136 TaxID=3366076 RepID=UPI003814CB54